MNVADLKIKNLVEYNNQIYTITEIFHNVEQAYFVKIENEMIRLARLKNQFVRKDISKEEAVTYFTNKGDEYKLELIEKRGDESLTLYTQGQFTDLCKGPHLPDTGFIKAVKLTKLGGAYWQGDDTRQQLTRIYGISFPKQKDLTEYEFMMAEAKKRDHRKLGKELDLSAHLTEVEIAALLARTLRLLDSGVMPMPNPEWPAIPWPAF